VCSAVNFLGSVYFGEFLDDIRTERFDKFCHIENQSQDKPSIAANAANGVHVEQPYFSLLKSLLVT
jgi:hypothetical protein